MACWVVRQCPTRGPKRFVTNGFADQHEPATFARGLKAGNDRKKDGLDDANLKSVVFADPCGNEFEVSTFHD